MGICGQKDHEIFITSLRKLKQSFPSSLPACSPPQFTWSGTDQLREGCSQNPGDHCTFIILSGGKGTACRAARATSTTWRKCWYRVSKACGVFHQTVLTLSATRVPGRGGSLEAVHLTTLTRARQNVTAFQLSVSRPRSVLAGDFYMLRPRACLHLCSTPWAPSHRRTGLETGQRPELCRRPASSRKAGSRAQPTRRARALAVRWGHAGLPRRPATPLSVAITARDRDASERRP